MTGTDRRTQEIEYIPDAAVDSGLDSLLREVLSICFTGPHDARFKWQRYFTEMPEHRWLIRQPGRVVAHLALHEKTIGSADGDLRIGGIAEVVVHPEWRGQGLVRQLLAQADAWMITNAIPFALLFGNPNVYRSSGYVPAANPIRHFDTGGNVWVVKPIGSTLVKALGPRAWPAGDIDLRGPTF